eukprot:gene8335-10239_t
MTSTLQLNEPSLYYFDGRGNGELTRLVLSFHGIKFEDVRIKPTEENLLPESSKSALTYGQVPVLKVNDQLKIAQSAAIARYVAKQFNFYGSTLVEQAKADELVDLIADFNTYIFFQVFKPSPIPDEVLEDFKTSGLPGQLKYWDDLLSKQKYFAGDSITVADLAFFVVYEYLHMFGLSDNLKPFQKLIQLGEEIKSHPKLVQYLQSRPPANF